ncbi:hypothetical protein CLAIMM_12952 [Cladophialophora immunda]|nr:hypothetical protein CLAIMM_12952 [Cladophialophora immunda]
MVPGRDWIDSDVDAIRIHNVLGAGDVDGTLSQYMVGDDCVLLAPKNLSWEESAAMVTAAGTAINVLDSIELKKGATSVIATSSNAEKLQTAKKLGASDLTNYQTTPDWADEVLCLTDGRGADLVCDVADPGTPEASVKALRQGGTACLAGHLTPPKAVDLVMPLMLGGKTLKGILIYSRAMLEKADALAEKYDLHPRIQEVYAWEDAPKAFERLRGQDFVGKLVIRV